jgi:hypothetical protein
MAIRFIYVMERYLTVVTALQLITELQNQMIFIASVHVILTEQYSRQPLANLSGLRLLKVYEEVEKPAISL